MMSFADTSPPRRDVELWVNGPEVARGPHQDVVGSDREQRGGALGLIWNENREFPAACLSGSDEPDRRLTVPARRPKKQVQIYLFTCIVEKLLKVSDAVGKDSVDQNDQSAVELGLIGLNEDLPVITARVLGVIERTLCRERYLGVDLADRTVKLAGFPFLSSLAAARASLAFSILRCHDLSRGPPASFMAG